MSTEPTMSTGAGEAATSVPPPASAADDLAPFASPSVAQRPTPSPPPPPAGWYANSPGPGQRYWDGTKWTDSYAPSAETPIALNNSYRDTRATAPALQHLKAWTTGAIPKKLIILGGVVALAVVIALVAGGGGSPFPRRNLAGSERSLLSRLAYDSAAKSNLKTAQTAEEIYATDNNGHYTSDTLSASDTGPLATIEPWLKHAPFVTATGNGTRGYTLVTTAATSGDVFSLTNADGVVTRSCTGDGGGCVGGTW